MAFQGFDAERAVEILTPGYGSGYRIGGRLILTAAHLFPDDEGNTCQVRSKQTFGTVEATVCWSAPAADIALIELPSGVAACEAVVFGKLPTGTANIIPFDLYGWPQWGQTTRQQEPPKAGGRHINGVIYLADYSGEDLLVLEPLRAPAMSSPGTQGSTWQGISGAAVICEGRVIAVQHHHQNPRRPASLEAEPLTKVNGDKHWRQHLARYGIDDRPKPLVPTPSSVPRLQALDWLNKLMPQQFQEVLFRYRVPPHLVPQQVAQNQQAIAVIQYAEQQEGEALPQLLKTIAQVAPHLSYHSELRSDVHVKERVPKAQHTAPVPKEVVSSNAPSIKEMRGLLGQLDRTDLESLMLVIEMPVGRRPGDDATPRRVINEMLKWAEGRPDILQKLYTRSSSFFCLTMIPW